MCVKNLIIQVLVLCCILQLPCSKIMLQKLQNILSCMPRRSWLLTLWLVYDDMQDSSSAEDSEPLHDDSYAAELAKLRERSRARIATARESQCSMLFCAVHLLLCIKCSVSVHIQYTLFSNHTLHLSEVTLLIINGVHFYYVKYFYCVNIMVILFVYRCVCCTRNVRYIFGLLCTDTAQFLLSWVSSHACIFCYYLGLIELWFSY